MAACVACAACAKDRAVGIRMESRALHDAVTEVRIFAFAAGEDSAIDCTPFDPRGKLPGDAEARTGMTADYKAAGPLKDPIGMLEDVPAGVYAVVIEGWDRREIDEQTRSILRAYECVVLDFSDPESSEGSITVPAIAPIGSTMRVPSMLNAMAVEPYGPNAPLAVADGVPANDDFVVQLLDDNSQDLPGKVVHFRVIEGRASFFAAGRTGTSTRTVTTAEDGVARVRIVAGAGASRERAGRIRVEAYAPGFDGAPLLFEAKALPSFVADVQTIDLPRARVDLGDSFTQFRPVIAADFDNDGRVDVATSAGKRAHRLVMLYAKDGGGFDLHLSREEPRAVLAMTTARLTRDPSAPRSIVAVTSRPDDRSTPEPSLEIWSNPGAAPRPGAEWTVASSRQGSLLATAVAAADLDGDGADDVGVIRCADVFFDCVDEPFTSPRNEIALFKNDGTGALTEVSVISAPPNEGGFRNLAFADLDLDQSADLIATTVQKTFGYCGNRDSPNFGFATPFFRNITLGQGWSVGSGRFTDDIFPDVVAVGGFRLAAPRAGLRLMPGCSGCVPSQEGPRCGFADGRPPSLLGPKDFGYMFPIAVADLNGDGWDDVLNLHRTKHALYTYLGTGRQVFALGPTIALPIGIAGELGATYEGPNAARTLFAATTAPDENKILVIRIRPR